jgi:hypothetical protein
MTERIAKRCCDTRCPARLACTVQTARRLFLEGKGPLAGCYFEAPQAGGGDGPHGIAAAIDQFSAIAEHVAAANGAAEHEGDEVIVISHDSEDGREEAYVIPALDEDDDLVGGPYCDLRDLAILGEPREAEEVAALVVDQHAEDQSSQSDA